MPGYIDRVYGICPVCEKRGTRYDIHRQHWFACDEHKKKWILGVGVLKTEKLAAVEETEANKERLRGYEEVFGTVSIPLHEQFRGVALAMLLCQLEALDLAEMMLGTKEPPQFKGLESLYELARGVQQSAFSMALMVVTNKDVIEEQELQERHAKKRANAYGDQVQT